MANAGKQLERGEVLAGLVSVLVPTLQLLLVASVSISGLLNFQNIFLYSNLISLVNVFTLFLTLVLIGLFWYWKNHNFLLFSRKPGGANQVYTPPEKKIFKWIRIASVSAALSLLIFVGTIVLFMAERYETLNPLFGVVQYVSYSTFLISAGIVLYIWLSEWLKKRQTFQREDFLQNLLNTLSDHGQITRPPVKVWRNEPVQGVLGNKLVDLEINGERFIFIVSFDGVEIYESYTKAEYDARQSVTVAGLQNQIQVLLTQIAELQRRNSDNDAKG